MQYEMRYLLLEISSEIRADDAIEIIFRTDSSCRSHKVQKEIGSFTPI